MNHSQERIVVDASALVTMMLPNPDPSLVQRLRTSVSAAPEIIDLEVVHVLRRHARSDPSTDRLAGEKILDLVDAAVVRLPHRPLLHRVWELRHSITAYDAAYVALAEQLNAPLVTCDAKLAGSHGHNACVELYPAS